jgi:sulfur carrier protein ThiS
MALVSLRGKLRELAGGRPEHALDGGTIRDLLRDLEREQPPVAGWILDERGRIRPHIAVFVNGRQGEEATPVAADDRVDVVQAISGGGR